MALERNFSVYGPVGQLWHYVAHPEDCPVEAVVEGPAGTGKTRPIAEWFFQLCCTVPGFRALWVRKTRVSLNNSVLDTFENQVLGPDHPMVLDGPSREGRKYYGPFPHTGARIDLGGMDNPTKLFSTEYHVIWANECQEFTKDEWESLHRALRRPGGFGAHLLLGDCNPDSRFHWLNQRLNRGVGERLVTRHYHNLAVTPEYLNRLRTTLTGARYARLFLGLWEASDRQVWQSFDYSKHVPAASLEKQLGRWIVDIPSWGDGLGEGVTADRDELLREALDARATAIRRGMA